MADDKHPEWLPIDWKVKEKNRCGRKRKWYIAPKNGLKFFSKPQVLRYLNEDVNTQQQQREVEQDKVTIERTVTEKLPAGWIKEIRTRKVSGKQRKDTFYIEPVTECEFRSMPSVLRYLEDKEGDEDHIGAEDDHSQSSPIEAEGKILIEYKEDEEFTTEKTVESEPSPPNSENSIQQNELQDIPIEDYLIEPCIDLSVESTKEEVQMDKSGETPAANSSSELPPDVFFNIPWFSPAYKLIIDEIPVETYFQQTSKRLSVPLQG